MQIRLQGSEQQCEDAVAALELGFELHQVSDFQQARGVKPGRPVWGFVRVDATPKGSRS